MNRCIVRTDKPIPEAVRRICQALSERYLFLCDQHDIPRIQSLAALVLVQRDHPRCGVSEMFTLAKQRLGVKG